MITVTFKKQADIVSKVVVEGHASYGEEGEDIVCAGISILTITILNAMVEVAGVKDIVREVKEGYTSFEVPKGQSAMQGLQITTLMDTFELGVRATEAAYGDYITVKDENGGELDD